MRKWLAITGTLLICLSCSLFPKSVSEHDLLTNIVNATQTGLANLPPPEVNTNPQNNPKPETPLPITIPAHTVTPTDKPNPAPTYQVIGSIGETVNCGSAFSGRVSDQPEYAKDLFKYHARDVFLIILLEMTNLSSEAIQIWDDDYFLEGKVDGELLMIIPQKDATGYLYITRGNNLHQELIKPGQKWKTYLAFDIDPRGIEWVLVVKPGDEIGKPVCEMRITLTE